MKDARGRMVPLERVRAQDQIQDEVGPQDRGTTPRS